MDKTDMVAFRERWKAVEAIEARELRTASVSLRWQQLNAIRRMALGLGLLPQEDRNVGVVYSRWSKLKEQFEDD